MLKVFAGRATNPYEAEPSNYLRKFNFTLYKLKLISSTTAWEFCPSFVYVKSKEEEFT